MQRLRDDRGAVTVIVALLMVALLGFAAIAVDVGAMWAKRQQLQNGADAGALAIAQGCARNACGTPTQTAQNLANGNVTDGDVTASVLSLTSGSVTVQDSGIRQHFFAPILGINQSTITTRASASWGSPSGGTAVLPLAFSYCEFLGQTSGGQPTGSNADTIYFPKSSTDPDTLPCTGPSNNIVPGGFGWLPADSGTCQATSAIAGILYSDPGNSVPSSCNPADFQAFQNKTVLLPIFDQSGASGSNAYYRVYGYAAFTVTGYHFAGQYSWNSPCNGNDRCIRGYFTKFVDFSDAFTYTSSAPQLGAAVVSLTE